MVKGTMKHYYIRRDDTKQPIACVAFNENDDGTVNRGISICSTREIFSKNKARNKAVGRLVSATTRKTNGHPIRTENMKHEGLKWYMFQLGGILDLVHGSDKMMKFKSCYQDIPNDIEASILKP